MLIISGFATKDIVIFQLVIQGCPANTEYPGLHGHDPRRSLLGRGKNQLLFLLPSDRTATLSRLILRSSFRDSTDIHPLWQTRPRVGPYSFSSRIFPARAYCCNAAVASPRSRGPPYGTLRKNVSRKNPASGRMSSLHSESNGNPDGIPVQPVVQVVFTEPPFRYGPPDPRWWWRQADVERTFLYCSDRQITLSPVGHAAVSSGLRE